MEKKDRIIDLKSKLNKLNIEKERWFKEKERLKKDISELIKKTKNLKKDKQNIDKEIKKFKNKRNEVNKKVKSLILNFKEFNKEFTGESVDVGYLKKQIDKLEMKVETEALSLTKEKKVMDEIRKLRKVVDENKVFLELDEKRKKLNKEIDEEKKEAERLHKKVQENALRSQRKYKEFIVLSKKINEMNKEQEKAFDNFVVFKKEFIKVSGLLDKRLKKLKIVEKKEDKKISRNLKNKIETVEEKLKKGGKLTTEDLIILQADK